MNRVVHLTKRVFLPERGKRLCKAVFAKNGRVKPHVVLVNGKEENHPEGCYYIEWSEGTKRIRISVGKDPQEALTKMGRKSSELNALNHGLAITPDNGSESLAIAIRDYLDETKLTKKKKTLAVYRTSLEYFKESCHKLNVADVDRMDLLKFREFLKEKKGHSPRTVANKFENVLSFFKAQGVRGLVGKNDMPRYTEEEPEIYEKDDLETLFAACNQEERMWYEFFLMTGMREQEVMHVYWSNVNFAANVITVTHKPDRGWVPKAYKERTIPIPVKLVKSLKAWKAKSDRGCNLMFPTSGCKPKLDFLDCLKRVAKRAELDPTDCILHKFRATFCTWALWGGVDLRTVQSWMGHSDIESTMRYLKPSRSQHVRDKVNEIFA